MRCRLSRLCPLAGLLAWSVAATAAGAAGPDAGLRPFHDRQIRPVPGYTLACQRVTELVNGGRTARGEVSVVLPADDGARVRLLRNDRAGRLFEIDLRVDGRGAVAGPPAVLRDGAPDVSPAAALVADSMRKLAQSMVYTGAPLSSGDTFIVPFSRDEVQATIDRLWTTPVRVESYIEVGRVAGMRHDDRFGEVVVIERAAQGVLDDHGTRIEFAARVRDGIATASGLPVTGTVDMTFDGPLGTLGGRETADCRYAGTPPDPQPQAKPTDTASLR